MLKRADPSLKGMKQEFASFLSGESNKDHTPQYLIQIFCLCNQCEFRAQTKSKSWSDIWHFPCSRYYNAECVLDSKSRFAACHVLIKIQITFVMKYFETLDVSGLQKWYHYFQDIFYSEILISDPVHRTLSDGDEAANLVQCYLFYWLIRHLYTD